MKFLNFKIGIAILVLLTVSGVVFWQQTQTQDISEINQDGSGINVDIATATNSTVSGFRGANNSLLNSKNSKSSDGTTASTKITVIPFGINNPFSYPDTDIGSERCVKNKSVFKKTASYSEKHIEISDLEKCLPVAVGYMNNMRNMGVNVISQHFNRRYDENGLPYFGIEEKEHKNHEVAIQMYVKDFDNYFWAAINPVSSKGFVGDINIETHKLLTENKSGDKFIYLPASEAGFSEWQKWLGAMFDYLNDHNATSKLAYVQIGNESDGDYAKKDGSTSKRDNKDDFYWAKYAKLVEKSYDIIKSRSPKTKIVIGSSGAGSVTFGGFQKPTLEYLSGKIDDNGLVVNGTKKCGGSGCFDVYDYHDFSGYKEYKGRTACQPKNCVKPILTVEKTPQNMKKLLSGSGFPDKKLVIQQGGTYTGQDDKEDKLTEYQSEEDQASYFAKRAIYLLANGVEQVLFGTYVEHSCYDGTIHNWFTMMGFAYNGIPKEGGDDCSPIGKKTKQIKQENKKVLATTGDCDGQTPCPDPGTGVKKLSYFTAKKLIEVLKGSDWDNLEAITTGRDDVHLYKIVKDGKTNYFAWWDWWNKCPRQDVSKPEMNTACIDKNKPTVSVSVGNAVSSVKATELVPDFDSGAKAEKAGYASSFRSGIESVKSGTATVKLGMKPVYVEVIK